MFKKIVVGTAFLVAALAMVPTAAQAHDSVTNYSGERYERDRYRQGYYEDYGDRRTL